MERCIDTALFGQVCDKCDGGAIYKILAECIEIFSILVGVLAILGIVIAGIMYATSAGDVARQTKARRRLIEVVIGIASYGLLFTFLNWLIPGGIIHSTLDSSTTSCPVEESTGPETPSEPEAESHPEHEATGEEPASEHESTPDPESESDPEPTPTPEPTATKQVKCPRNKNRSYQGSDSGLLDSYFRSEPSSSSCPSPYYATYEKSKNCPDNFHESGNWCIINSKIDVYEYERYLQANYINQDRFVRRTDGSTDATEAIMTPENKNHPLRDGGACGHYSQTFANNLNSGELVSNDAFAKTSGSSTVDYAKQGKTTGGNQTAGGQQIYDDGLTMEDVNNYPGGAGTAASFLVGNPNGTKRSDSKTEIGEAYNAALYHADSGWGQHMVTFIGVSKSCYKDRSSCDRDDLLILDPMGAAIKTLSDTDLYFQKHK